jgi:hypothetical protein
MPKEIAGLPKTEAVWLFFVQKVHSANKEQPRIKYCGVGFIGYDALFVSLFIVVVN